MEKDNRIRINKRMMAWSDGSRVNVIPSVYRQVDDYGRMLIDYHRRIDEGYLVDLGPCTNIPQLSNSQLSILNLHEASLTYILRHTAVFRHSLPDGENLR